MPLPKFWDKSILKFKPLRTLRKPLRQLRLSSVQRFAVKKYFFLQGLLHKVQGLKITIGQKFIDALVNSSAPLREMFSH